MFVYASDLEDENCSRNVLAEASFNCGSVIDIQPKSGAIPNTNTVSLAAVNLRDRAEQGQYG
jgi:hypothetical protein